MRNVGIQEFTCFHHFCPFSPGNHHSRSLEGKYTFLGGICWVLGQWRSESVISVEFRRSKVYLKVYMSEFVYTSNRNRDYALCRNSGIHLFFTILPVFTRKSQFYGLRRKVYVSGRDLMGIRSREPESVILGRIRCSNEFLNSDMAHNHDFLFRSVHEFLHAHFQTHRIHVND